MSLIQEAENSAFTPDAVTTSAARDVSVCEEIKRGQEEGLATSIMDHGRYSSIHTVCILI